MVGNKEHEFPHHPEKKYKINALFRDLTVSTNIRIVLESTILNADSLSFHLRGIIYDAS